MEGLKCYWPKCEYVATTDNWTNNLKALNLHLMCKHQVKMDQPKVEEGGDATKKKRTEKRAQAKLPLFEEVETREEFTRKSNEFFTYASRTSLEPEEQAEDLYSALSTSLRRRILASPRINKVWRKTDPMVIMEEMEKICLPPINLVV